MRISDLTEISGYSTVQEWLDSFGEDDRNVIVEAMMTAQPKQVWPILSNLDDNPYPFTKSSLEAYMRRIKGEQ